MFERFKIIYTGTSFECVVKDYHTDNTIGMFKGEEALIELVEIMNEQQLFIDDLLYQIGHIGKNNKTCRDCYCYLDDIGYCTMYDMNVKADDVVVDCSERRVKEILEEIE